MNRARRTRSSSAAADSLGQTQSQQQGQNQSVPEPGLTESVSPADSRYQLRRSERKKAQMQQAGGVQQDDQRNRDFFNRVLTSLVTEKEITEEEYSRIQTEGKSLKSNKLLEHLEQSVGEKRLERFYNPVRITRQKAQNLRAQEAGNLSRQPTYQRQHMMNSYGMIPMMRSMAYVQPPVPGQMSVMPNQTGRLLQRLGPFHGDSFVTPMDQRTVTGTPSIQSGMNIQSQEPSQEEFFEREVQFLQQSQGNYVSEPQRSKLADGRSSTEAGTTKRGATQTEGSVSRNTRSSKARRTVEDPSAPDVGDMDVVTEAAIHLREEQEALLNDFPSQGVSDIDGMTVESDFLNVGAVKLRLTQILREQGMQLSGLECLDVVIQGMEEKFEGFLRRIVKRAVHRRDTTQLADGEGIEVTSEVRGKLREIKKKEEQSREAKVREEKKKLELLAETASKKELANNKELAAKVERFNKDRQFNAETEAANRTLSNAFGGLSFEKYWKQKRDREATALSRPALTLGISNPNKKTKKSSTASEPAGNASSVIQETRPVCVNIKDVQSVMSQDRTYAFSPVLCRLLL